MPKKLVLATRNSGKIIEFRRILEELAPGAIELIGVDEFPDLIDVEETGTTFEENSLLKARYTSQATELPAIADDSMEDLEFFQQDGQVNMGMIKQICRKFLIS
jgi:XTP/dITP diphosphohydrolase